MFFFSIKAFVDSNPEIKWCPFPECGMAVRNPCLNLENETDRNQSTSLIKREYSSSVDCGNGHYFCWDCLQDGHQPASCQQWKNWFEKILEIKPEERKYYYFFAKILFAPYQYLL